MRGEREPVSCLAPMGKLSPGEVRQPKLQVQPRGDHLRAPGTADLAPHVAVSSPSLQAFKKGLDSHRSKWSLEHIWQWI